MRVTRIGWAGTRTSEYSAMVAFLQGVLGLTTSQEGSDFAAFQRWRQIPGVNARRA
jgi:hypothetical protein